MVCHSLLNCTLTDVRYLTNTPLAPKGTVADLGLELYISTPSMKRCADRAGDDIENFEGQLCHMEILEVMEVVVF